ncbi:MAG: hypothetical protein HC850_01920 [Rhodomicrobium sp.]|nr:hypothetical protein [Rhodomicrobium sp.]
MDANQDEPAGEADRAASPDLDLGAMGAQLRGLYKELLDEPVPDRFIKLLEELEEKDPGKQ